MSSINSNDDPDEIVDHISGLTRARLAARLDLWFPEGETDEADDHG